MNKIYKGGIKHSAEMALVKRLEKIADDFNGDPEAAHSKADDALIEAIGSKLVADRFEAINKWYA